MMRGARSPSLGLALVSLLSALLILPCVLHADTEQTNPADPLIEHVQVTATRIPQETGTTPASVTVITGEELRRRGAYDLRTALLLAAGIDVAPGGDGGPASSVPELWGLREFDAFLLTVDGVPSGGAFNPALATLDLTDVDRIEVLRGSAPVIYGATSFVGVINVIHGGAGEGRSTLRAAGGSYGSGSLGWHSDLPTWSGVRSWVNADATQMGFSDSRTEYQRGHLRWENSRLLGSGAVRFGLDGTWLRQDPASPHPREGTELSSQVPLDANHNPRGSHLDDNRYTVDASYEHKLQPGTWSSILSVSHSDQNILRGFLTDLTGATPDANGQRETIPTLDVYFDSHVALVPHPRLDLVAGIDHLHGRGDAQGGDFDYFVNLDGRGTPAGDDLPNQSRVHIQDRREFSGLYGQTCWRPSDRWNLVLGIRLNRTAESRSTDALEFSTGTHEVGEDHRSLLRGGGFAGFTWTAWTQGEDALHLYANYRNTFKPAAIDFGLDADPETLAPETADSYEAGLKGHLLGNRLALELSAFRMDMENLVVSQNVGGVPTLINAGSERFRGVELSAGVRLRSDLYWRTSYSLHDARFVDFVTDFGGVSTQLGGNRLEMSARNMAATELMFTRAQGWQGSLEANWVGSRFLNRRNTALAPDYLTWSAGLGYRMRSVEIRLDGYNLNDQRPPVSESELGDAQYYRLPARRIELSARWLLGSRNP